MKFSTKLLSLLIVALLCVGLFGATPVSAADDTVLAATPIQTRQDEEFTTTLYVPNGASICDLTVCLNYDPQLITLVKATTANASTTVNTSTPGTIILAFGSGSNTVKDTNLVDLTFRVDAFAGIGAYDLLTVNEKFDNTASRVDDMTGAYEDVTVKVSIPTLVLYEMGDVNLDQKVNTRDVSILKRHLTFLPTSPTLTDFHLRIADAEKDGSVNMRDVARIMRRCAFYLDDVYGDRLNITFYNADGSQFAVKSVVYGGDLTRLPPVPTLENYEEGRWSASPDSYVVPDLTGITTSLELYAVYGQYQSDAIAYYKQQLTAKYYSGDLPTGLTGTMQLDDSMNYQAGYHGEFIWQSSNSYILNGTTGEFNKPPYATELVLTAVITSYDADNVIEAQDTIDFVYQVGGIYSTPTKDEIAQWVHKFLKDKQGNYLINYNVELPRCVTDEHFQGNTNNFEVRLDWVCQVTNEDGSISEYPISEISRTTNPQTIDLIATITFNGKPLEDDGKVYVDDVTVTAIEQSEIKSYIIEQIAQNVPTKLSEGWELWDEDTKYGTTIVWQTGNVEVATIANNTVDINQSVVNGTLLPLEVTVSYGTKNELGETVQKEFTLNYTASVITDSTVLTTNDIDQYLYQALLDALEKVNGYDGNTLTTAALRAQEFVSLDLSGYPQIKDLKGLSYCTNLRALDISGLKITDNLNQIATLSNLEALIAKDCGLSSFSVGATAVLDNAINLKLLDLSNNNFSNLDSVLSAKTTYGQLREVYLNDNCITDISRLANAPALTMLALSNNGLTTEDLSQLANFPYLNYLSLANNQIDSVEPLATLTNLVELRLQHNQISDVTPLRKLIFMNALYLNDNQISKGVEYLNTMTKLKVLYLNDNRINSISALTSLSNLEAINVTNNPMLNDLNVLKSSKATLQEIYAENNAITSFNFIEGMTNLRVLMLSGNAKGEADASTLLTGHLSGLRNLQVLTLSDKPLYDLNFLANMPKLVRLDVANCGLTATADDGTSNIQSIANRYSTLKVLDISNNSFHGAESELLALKELSNLMIFYADNTCGTIDLSTLVKSMAQLSYISMENCGVSDLSWMRSKYNLVFVDLVGNTVENVDLSAQLSDDSLVTLEYLYLDTANSNATFANWYNVGVSNIDLAMKELSLKGISTLSIGYLPLMENLTYLNLADTDLPDLIGTNEFGETYPITRFTALQALDLSGLELDLTPVEDLPNLKTLWAVDVPSRKMFFKDNLHTLQRLYGKHITGYLYNTDTLYAPVAKTEGDAILDLLPDFSCDIIVAADGIISKNNPVLPSVINDYTITWTVSNTDNYEIADNRIAVKSYENIDDEVLTLTASIVPYDDQEAVTRSFTINTAILRASADTRSKYYLVDTTGFGETLQRSDEFSYHIELQTAVHPEFSVPVKPVVDSIAYSFSALLANGETTPSPNFLEEQENHRFKVLDNTPLNATITITVELLHKIDGQEIVDDTVTAAFTVVERSYTVTYVPNGGTVTDANGLMITSQKKAEESNIFEGITVTRTGYLFDGWYTDEALTQPYWKEGDDAMKMPASDLTLYAKWTAHSFNLYFDANGGTVEEASRLVLCDTAFGDLPTPTRSGFTFGGWFTADGTEITKETSMATAEDVTVTAKWTVIPYTVSWSTGTGYSIAVERTASPNGNAGTGKLSSGDTVYYGDTLAITYTAATGYSLSTKGAAAVTVTGNVTGSTIYATATANSYTYNIKYVSVNGTNLGTGTATYKYGTTNTITAKTFAGYTTPAAQSVTWDSTSAKTITFTYAVVPTTNPKGIASGAWWNYDGAARITYSVSAEYRNRTANSVQVRVIWTNTIVKNYFYGYAQYFSGTVGGIGTGNITICTASTWAKGNTNTSSARSQTAYSGWITVSLNTTNQTNVSLSGKWWDGMGLGGNWSGSITVPAY